MCAIRAYLLNLRIWLAILAAGIAIFLVDTQPGQRSNEVWVREEVGMSCFDASAAVGKPQRRNRSHMAASSRGIQAQGHVHLGGSKNNWQRISESFCRAVFTTTAAD
jgi:hypothetical protein